MTPPAGGAAEAIYQTITADLFREKEQNLQPWTVSGIISISLVLIEYPRFDLLCLQSSVYISFIPLSHGFEAGIASDTFQARFGRAGPIYGSSGPHGNVPSSTISLFNARNTVSLRFVPRRSRCQRNTGKTC
jgi:hypothetical protein